MIIGPYGLFLAGASMSWVSVQQGPYNLLSVLGRCSGCSESPMLINIALNTYKGMLQEPRVSVGSSCLVELRSRLAGP